jgi:hypothetical protein
MTFNKKQTSPSVDKLIRDSQKDVLFYKLQTQLS